MDAPHTAPSLLRAQLDLCRRLQPELGDRLEVVGAPDHLSLYGGRLQRRIHRQHCHVEPDAATIETILRSAAGWNEFLLFGVGGGDLLRALLDVDPSRRITAWDRDAHLIRACLERQDLRAELLSGRLRFALGIDLLDLDFERRVLHPVLTPLYRRELSFLDEDERGPVALLHDGTLYVDDAERALRSRGWSVYTIDSRHEDQSELLHTAQRSGAELVFTVNHFPGIDAFADAAGLQAMAWEIDPNVHCPQPPSHPERYHLFSWRKANVPRYREVGYRHVHHLPLAADPKLRRPLSERIRGAPVSFVGASLQDEASSFSRDFVCAAQTICGLSASEAERLFDEAMEEQARDLFAYRLPELLAARFPALIAQRDVDWVTVAAQRAAAHKRRRLVSLLACSGIEVWGDRGWSGLPGVRYRGRGAAHGEELTALYASSTINLDIGRIYQEDIVTLRVFDVLSCGGFLLTQDSPELRELFEVGQELETYASEDELEDKVEWYLSHPRKAREIGHRGREAVIARHDLDERFSRLLSLCDITPPRSRAVLAGLAD